MSSEIYLHVKKDEYLNKLKNITTNLYLQGIKAIYSFTIEIFDDQWAYLTAKIDKSLAN